MDAIASHTGHQKAFHASPDRQDSLHY